MSFKQYTRTIAAGDTVQLNASGEFCRSMAANIAGLEVELNDGLVFSLNEGEKFRTPLPFEKMNLINTAASPLTVTLLIGVGDFDASSLVGTVSIDSSTPVNVNVSSGADLLRAKSAAAQEFGLHGAQAATASKYGCIQLINPAASGVTVAVNSIIVSCNVAGIAASLHQYNTALANTSTQQGRNKLNGGADALAELNYEALSAFLSLTYISYKVVNGVYMPMQMIETSPLILGEGEGCLVACNSVNQFITADFEWSEY